MEPEHFHDSTEQKHTAAATLAEMVKSGPAKTLFNKDWRRKHPIATWATILLGLILFIRCCDTASHPSHSGISVGDQGRLAADTSGPDLVLAVNEQAYDEMVMAGDDRTLAVMVLNGSCFLAPKGTRVKVLDWKTGARKVLVLDGPTIGREGWLPSKFVQ